MIGSKLGSHLREDCRELATKYRGKSKIERTVQSGIHAAQINQQAHHCHVLCRLMLSQELISQDLASLATPGHRVNIEIGKGLLGDLLRLVAVGENSLVVLKHGFEKLVLDILPPERLSVVLLEMLHLVAAIHRVVLRAARWWLLALARRGRLGGRLPYDLARRSHLFVFRHLDGSSWCRRCIFWITQDVL
jgi:hypothetical protein